MSCRRRANRAEISADGRAERGLIAQQWFNAEGCALIYVPQRGAKASGKCSSQYETNQPVRRSWHQVETPDSRLGTDPIELGILLRDQLHLEAKIINHNEPS